MIREKFRGGKKEQLDKDNGDKRSGRVGEAHAYDVSNEVHIKISAKAEEVRCRERKGAMECSAVPEQDSVTAQIAMLPSGISTRSDRTMRKAKSVQIVKRSIMRKRSCGMRTGINAHT